MQISRNETCPCGSGLRYKRCCGSPSRQAPVVSPRRIPPRGILPVGNCGEPDIPDPFYGSIKDLLQRGNLAQAEILLRMALSAEPGDARALNHLGWIASEVNMPRFALRYFNRAIEIQPNWQLPRVNSDLITQYCADIQGHQGANAPTTSGRGTGERFLVTQAWGFGFWSDVGHVIGSMLIAELSNRIPIVHWGKNSLFGHDGSENAFESFFEPVSDRTIHDLQNADMSFWPPKWHHRNLAYGAINQWDGPFSRVAGLYLLGREETVVVSDFYTSVFDLLPWIPEDSKLYGMSVNEVSRYLVHKYLRPTKAVLARVAEFHDRMLAGGDYIAVHVRGSDKHSEQADLERVNGQYEEVIDSLLSSHGCERIFLMTDDMRLRDRYAGIYGKRLVHTDCHRTSTSQGTHYHAVADRRELGIEVMMDVYLAVGGKAFVGNAFSNPSLFVRLLKKWPPENIRLLGGDLHNRPNIDLHSW